MLCMVPINNLALGTMPPESMKNASGLFNLMRNLGGAVGLALINTMLDKRMDLHLERLRESVVWGRTVADETLAQLTAALAARGSDAALAATKQDGADGAPAGGSARARRRLSRADRGLLRPLRAGGGDAPAAGDGGGGRRTLTYGAAGINLQ